MVKERISLTLDSDVVARIDRKLEQKGISNRSQGIEQLLKDYLKQESVSDAVILAGGEDSNAFIKINGRPVIEHILDHLDREGVERVFIATNDPDLEHKISLNRNLNISVLAENKPHGTAGALRQVRDTVKDTFLVMNGDVLCEADLEDMKAAHEAADTLATVALTTVRDSADYGVIRMKGNTVVGFTEKPDESFSHLINAGIYLIEPDLLDHIPPQEKQQVIDLESLFEQLAEEGQLNGYVYDGEWREVG